MTEANEVAVCNACDEEAPVDTGTMVLVDTTRVDGFVVDEEYAFTCESCTADAEEAQMEAQREAGYWRGYDRWEARHGG